MKETKSKIPQAVLTALTENHLSNASYSPAHLVDMLIQRLALKNDAALSRMLQLSPPVISKIRSRKAEVTPAILLRMHDVTGLAINDLRALMGVNAPVIQ